MDSRYDHALHEGKTYAHWEKADAFNPDAQTHAQTTGKSFSIAMPPPNANDPLHVGHAMFISLEDILIRYHRMLGDDTLWQPGTDHAGIETQFVFEKKLAKQGQSRFNFDRNTLYQKIWDYVQENSDTAVNQMKKLGASADWSRFHFMLEPELVKIVLETFTKLHEADLVYRDLRLVNYCTKCGTSFSELEVNYEDRTVPFYYMKYGPFTLGTTRPETKFGDTAVAVHPEDPRYQHYIGQTVEVEGLNGPFSVKVIADDYVDPEFGTGVVKITPYHDFNDYEVWQRHLDELPQPRQVIGFDGRLNELTGPYAGLKVAAARQKIAEDLEAKGLLVKTDQNYKTRIGTCYRCGTVIEPLPLPQFFIKVKPLVKPVIEALDKGDLTVHGAGHDKILRHWLENLKDWNISRQIVWGIRMPIWYKLEGNQAKIRVGFLNQEGTFTQGTLSELLKTYSLANITHGLQTLTADADVEYRLSQTELGDDYIQETDTFDTWFSSAQWPFSTLKANGEQDFTRFYPTTVMETGYDILPFWVMRMLMIGKFATGQFPYHTVYLHGLVRDAKGQKMSKSKGNVINPLEIIERYGADALRMALVIRSSAGLDKSVGEADFKAMRNLSNKIWNASRYVILQTATASDGEFDTTFKEKLTQLVSDVTQQLTDYKIGLAAETVYNEFWHWFCDECIEKNKEGKISRTTLIQGLVTFLKLLHPFVPFVTEAVWQELHQAGLIPQENKLLINAHWPTK